MGHCVTLGERLRSTIEDKSREPALDLLELLMLPNDDAHNARVIDLPSTVVATAD